MAEQITSILPDGGWVTLDIHPKYLVQSATTGIYFEGERQDDKVEWQFADVPANRQITIEKLLKCRF